MPPGATADARLVTDARVRELLAQGDRNGASALVIRGLGAEVFGFLCGAMGQEADAEEVFSAVAERVWRSIAAFRWQCSLRTWVYVIARHEMSRFLEGAARRNAGRAASAELLGLVVAVRTETRSALRTEKYSRLRALRDELPIEDRTLLILRVDREMAWEDIARAYLGEESGDDDAAVKREAARLRKRFQIVRKRLADRAREEGLLT